jgi:DNA-directed RNA polymerase specialized sigma24 family protein
MGQTAQDKGSDEGRSDEAYLEELARSGDVAAFDTLWARHADNLRGLVRVNARNDMDGAEIFQQLYVVLREKVGRLDPARGTFRTFARYWARLCTLRYYRESGRRWVLLPDLMQRHPELEQDDDVLAFLAPSADPTFPVQTPARDWVEEGHRLRVSRDLLALLLADSPPHQLMAFLLRNAVVPGDALWPPRRIVAKLSDMSLENLLEIIVDDYAETSWRPDTEVRADFRPVRVAMDRAVGEVIADPATCGIYRQLLDRRLGDTCFRDYYTTGTHEQNISAWCFAVERRVIKAVVNRPSESLLQFEGGRARRKRAGRGTPPVEDPCTADDRAAREAELLHRAAMATLESPMPPHQLIVLLRSKVPDQPGAGGPGWLASRIVEDASEKPLALLLDTIRDEYVRASRLPASVVGPAFDRLRARLAEDVSAAFARRHPSLAGAVVGATCLQHHYATGRALRDASGKLRPSVVSECVAEVQNWLDAVMGHVFGVLVRAERRHPETAKNALPAREIVRWQHWTPPPSGGSEREVCDER